MISLVSLIGGPLGLARLGAGLGIGVVLFGIYDAMIDDPHIREIELRECVIRTQQKAQEAADAVRLQFQKGDQAALDEFEQDLQKSTERLNQTIGNLKGEIADYEAQLAAQGRTCPLSGDDFVELRGGLPP